MVVLFWMETSSRTLQLRLHHILENISTSIMQITRACTCRDVAKRQLFMYIYNDRMHVIYMYIHVHVQELIISDLP